MSPSASSRLSYLKNPVKYYPLPSGHRFFRDCQRETYARWIEWAMWAGHPKPGVWFVTLTFKTFISEWRAWVLLKRWIGHLRESYTDIKGSDRLRWICAIEWQVREVVHFHLLITGDGLNDLSRKKWESRWEATDRITGFCRVYDADRKAAPYLAKYINKGSELSRGGYWRGLITPGSITCCMPNPSVSSVESRGISQVAGN